MIIWGSKVRHQKLSEGEFWCPKCQAQRLYYHKMAARYFTLYFIPLFPLQQLGEIVECQTCKVAYQTSVLSMSRPKAEKQNNVATNLAELINNVPARLKNGDPLDYVIRDLTAAGVDLDIARQTVQSAAGSSLRKCPHCGLVYINEVGTCAECGRTLPA
jgi:DNA-directed RNA polymerase subunit M/transcription elongation factor TFIIS